MVRTVELSVYVHAVRIVYRISFCHPRPPLLSFLRKQESSVFLLSNVRKKQRRWILIESLDPRSSRGQASRMTRKVNATSRRLRAWLRPRPANSMWGRGLFERSEFRSPRNRDWGKGTRRAAHGRKWFLVLLPKQKDLVARGRNPASVAAASHAATNAAERKQRQERGRALKRTVIPYKE